MHRVETNGTHRGAENAQGRFAVGLSLSLPHHRLSPSLERRKVIAKRRWLRNRRTMRPLQGGRFFLLAFDCGRQRTVRITQTPRLSVHDFEIVRTLA
jgi:hypothetical protein